MFMGWMFQVSSLCLSSQIGPRYTKCHVLEKEAFFFFFQAEDGIRDWSLTGVQTCALPIRSEEHTSELKSLTNIVCRLLLEKTKNDPSELNLVISVVGGSHVQRSSLLLTSEQRHSKHLTV